MFHYSLTPQTRILPYVPIFFGWIEYKWTLKLQLVQIPSSALCSKIILQLASLCHRCSTIGQPFLLALHCRSHSFEGPCIYSVRFLSESLRAYLIPCCLLDVILLYRQCILHNRNRRADTDLFCTITAVLYAAILFLTLFQSAAEAISHLCGWQSIRICLELYSKGDSLLWY